MDFKIERDAIKAGLIQHTVWLQDVKHEREFLQNRYSLIMRDKFRKCMFVKRGFMIALFVNDVSIER